MKIVLRKSLTSEPYTFTFLDRKNNSVVRSEGYNVKNSALNDIESIRENCLNDASYEMKQAKNGKFFFNLKAFNDQVVGTSTFYETMDQRTIGIARFKMEAPYAILEERRG